MFTQRAIIGSLFEQELFCIMVFEVIRGLNHRWYFECVVKSAPSPKQVFLQVSGNFQAKTLFEHGYHREASWSSGLSDSFMVQKVAGRS